MKRYRIARSADEPGSLEVRYGGQFLASFYNRRGAQAYIDQRKRVNRDNDKVVQAAWRHFDGKCGWSGGIPDWFRNGYLASLGRDV